MGSEREGLCHRRAPLDAFQPRERTRPTTKCGGHKSHHPCQPSIALEIGNGKFAHQPIVSFELRLNLRNRLRYLGGAIGKLVVRELPSGGAIRAWLFWGAEPDWLWVDTSGNPSKRRPAQCARSFADTRSLFASARMHRRGGAPAPLRHTPGKKGE